MKTATMKTPCKFEQIDDKRRARAACKRQSLAEAVVMLVLAGALLCSSALGAPSDQQQSATQSTSGGGGDGESAASRSALETELNALLQQHEEGSSGADSKSLSEAIISRLMLANLSDVRADEDLELQSQQQDDSSAQQLNNGELTGPEAMRLRKLLAYLHNYELLSSAVSPGGAINNGQAFDQFPVLPASQAATIKRASMKLGNFVRGGGAGGVGGSQSHHSSAQRQLNGGAYGRTQSFDFGLGKRPDASVAGNFLRFGDSGAGSHMQTVASGLGKRPSAHRYDFGLGKRVASPAYPRYDFGLGKRVPNRIRYDFGLGK